MRVLVVGGGPAGVSAALHARELGADVTMVESGSVGGTSLNHGPAPVRTLARAARLMRDTGSWETFGLHGTRPTVDLGDLLGNADRVARYAHEHKRLADFLCAQGIDLIDEAGPARLVDPFTLETSSGQRHHADRVIIAVGGRPGRLPIPGQELALTYADVRDLKALPESTVVIGGADTGCQLASILADLGVEVTLLEAGPRLLARSDADLSEGLLDAFRRRDIDVHVSSIAERLEAGESGVTVHVRVGDTVERYSVGAVFFAVGWPSNADALGAQEVGIAMERGYVAVDDSLRTSVAGVYAAGDVNGLSMLVPSARHEGRLAAENAVLGTRRRFTHDIVPTGSFTDPEYGSVGLTEEQARERGECEVAVVRYHDLLRPVADGRPEGFCKLIVDGRRRYVLGAHVLGEYSAEVIQTVAACMESNMRVEQIADIQFAFPTFTEAIGVAAQDIVRSLGVAPMARSWSDLHPQSDPEDLR
jgi:pyruvate/2-oxoglutarate dehydrogenase complex dihydrolipoamide dehydrogenase (E3) component